jgi:hypothetical protein
MAKYRISDRTPQKKAYVNVSGYGPKLVKVGAEVDLADNVEPATWMDPLDDTSKVAHEAATKKAADREKARAAKKARKKR